MKKKILIGIAALFVAALTLFSVQASKYNGNISLDDLAIMSIATSSLPNDCVETDYTICYPYLTKCGCMWDVEGFGDCTNNVSECSANELIIMR